MRPKQKRRLNKKEKFAIASTAIVAEQILLSFGNASLAECGGYSNGNMNVCISATNNAICVPEESTVNVTTANFSDFPLTVSLANPDSEDYHITGITIGSAENNANASDTFALAPNSRTYNNYPAGPPAGVTTTQYEFSFTSPSVPANNGGPISTGNGRTTFTVDPTGTATYYDGFTYAAPPNYPEVNLVSGEADFLIHVDHVNEAPEISSPNPPDYSLTVASSATLTDVEVSAVFSDAESNNLDLVFQLSSQSNFSTILQTASYNIDASPTGVTQAHTWNDLAPGTYYWRISAVETDSLGACEGFETEIDPVFLTANSDDLPINISTVSSLPAAGIARSNFSLVDIGFVLVIAGLLGLLKNFWVIYTKLKARVHF